jgi:cell surface protein SprA
MPGFMGMPKIIGLGNLGNSLAPGLDFVMGGQATDFLLRAKSHGWVTNDSTMINPYVMQKSTNLNIRLTLEPVRDLQITLTGLRNERKDLTTYDITVGSGVTQAIGSFSISVITLKTAFQKFRVGKNYQSDAFDRFNSYRKNVAWRFAHERQNNSGGSYQPGGEEFPLGYGNLSQEALIPAFRAAYTGQSPSKVSLGNFWNLPLPNWTIRYSGFSHSELFKRYFRTGSIEHSYSSIYSVNAYNWNDEFMSDHYGYSWVRNQLGDYIPRNNILNVSIRESFNPLIRLNLTWQNDMTTSFSIVRNRTLGLSLSNYQVLEMVDVTYRADVSYFFKKVPLIFKFGEDRQKKMDTDLKLTAGFSYGNDQSFIRSLEETEQVTQLSAGNRKTSIRIAADYTIYKGIILRGFYNYEANLPWVSAISRSETYFGFGLSVSLSN